MPTLTELCETSVLHAEGNRDRDVRRSAFKNLMKGLVSHRLGGARWHDDLDQDWLAARIDLDDVASHCVELARRYAGGGPDREAAVQKVCMRVGVPTQSAASIESSDVWTAVRNQVVVDLQQNRPIDHVALVDRVAEDLEKTSRRKRDRRASDAKTGADANLRRLIAKARKNPPAGVSSVDMRDESALLAKIREYASDGDLFEEVLTEGQMFRLAQVVVFEDPSRQPMWMRLAPAEWQFPQRWEEATTGEWALAMCAHFAALARPADAPAKDATCVGKHVKAPVPHTDVVDELWALFSRQLRRACIRGFVLDENPYDLGAKPETWWFGIIRRKASEAWKRVMQRAVRDGELIIVSGYTLGSSDRFGDDGGGEDHNPEMGDTENDPETVALNSANRLITAAADAVAEVAEHGRLLAGWDDTEAQAIKAVAQNWLLEDAAAALTKRDTRRRNLDGNIQQPCTEYLLDVHSLSMTRDEQQASRLAGILAERALYLAIQQGAAGDVGSLELTKRLRASRGGSSRTRVFLDGRQRP